jgi:hypothetical protein
MKVLRLMYGASRVPAPVDWLVSGRVTCDRVTKRLSKSNAKAAAATALEVVRCRGVPACASVGRQSVRVCVCVIVIVIVCVIVCVCLCVCLLVCVDVDVDVTMRHGALSVMCVCARAWLVASRLHCVLLS